MLKENIIDFIKDVTIPPACVVCGKLSADYLCEECSSQIITISSDRICSYWGRPFTGNISEMCSSCKNGDYNFTVHRSFAFYKDNMKKIIRKYKYNKIFGLKDILIRFLSDAYDRFFAGLNIDYIDTVPGEHTNILAENFSAEKGIPLGSNIIKIRRPERQRILDLAGRKVNILDCYKLKDCLAYRDKNILIIDDVWTTGNTLREICRALGSGKVKGIYLLTLARRA